MYAITGITGQIGGVIGGILLAAGQTGPRGLARCGQRKGLEGSRMRSGAGHN